MPPPETETPVTQELVAGARRSDLDGMDGVNPGVRPVKPGKSPHPSNIAARKLRHKNCAITVEETAAHGKLGSSGIGEQSHIRESTYFTSC